MATNSERAQAAEDRQEPEADKLRLAGAAGLEAFGPDSEAKASFSSERLGKVVISAESDETRQTLVGYSAEQIRSMPRDELLTLAESIVVGGTSLRRIYETNLIGEGGLRRLVINFSQSRELLPLLKAEILEHEKDFERDPALRDRAVQSEVGRRALMTLDRLMASDEAKPKTRPIRQPASKALSGSFNRQIRSLTGGLGPIDKLIGLTILILILVVLAIVIARQ